MRNIMSKRIQHFSWSHPAFTAVEILLLLILVLCVCGQWYILFMMVCITTFISISMLLLSTMYQMNRNSGSDDYHHPFTYLPTYRILDSLADPRPSRSEQERIEQQGEDFKPFVFKDHPEDSEHE
jgi:hypothetical protein